MTLLPPLCSLPVRFFTDDERAYLERAVAQRRKGQGNPTATPSAAPGGIDWEKARVLHQREQRGDKLTPEEEAYLKRAVAARNASAARPANQRPAPARLIPLTDLADGDRYEREDGGLYGGLYGGGRNTPRFISLTYSVR